MSDRPLEEIASLLDLYAASGNLHGTGLITLNNEIVLEKNYGYADEEQQIKNSPGNIYKIGSLSKQYTAVLILQLIQQGKLEFTTEIGDLLEETPEQLKTLTIHQLLSHSSGIASYNNTRWMSARSYLNTHTRIQLLDLCLQQSLEFNPGEDFLYSNTGYVLLGLILERITGRPFEALVYHSLAKPLGLKKTGHGNGRDAECMPGYLRSEGSFTVAPTVNITSNLGAGGIFTTPHELVEWGKSFDGNTLLDDKFRHLMFNYQASNYGYGWYLSSYNRHDIPTTYAYHGGFMMGYKSYLGVLLDSNYQQRASVVLFDNHSGTGLLNMTHKILSQLLDLIV